MMPIQINYPLSIISTYLIDIVAFSLLILGFKIFKKKINQYKVSQIKGAKDKDELFENSFDNGQAQIDLDEFQEIQSRQNARILEKLIRNDQIDIAEEMIQNHIDKPCTFLLTILLKGYSKTKNFDKASKLIKKMEESLNSKPNLVTYNTYMKICVDCQQYQTIEKIYENNNEKDLITHSVYICGLLAQNKITEAQKVYNMMINQKSYQLDQIFFNIMINGLMKQNQIDQAYQIFQQMKQFNFKFNDYSLSIIIQLHSALGLSQEAQEFFIKYHYNSPYVNSCIIKMLVQQKKYQSVIDVFTKLNNRDQVIYSQVIQFLMGNKQYFKQTFEIFQNSIDSNIILRSYLYERAIIILTKIINYEIVVNNFQKIFAQHLLSNLLEFLKFNQIQLSKEMVHNISQNIQRKIIFEKQLNLAGSKKKNLFNRAL